ncbi:hypothetical protein F4679DRAFT_522205 [Xylaria curta]|nr:hypothetical protein F4679DRAFT_522205 [Xylaria curta]
MAFALQACFLMNLSWTVTYTNESRSHQNLTAWCRLPNPISAYSTKGMKKRSYLETPQSSTRYLHLIWVQTQRLSNRVAGLLVWRMTNYRPNLSL